MSTSLHEKPTLCKPDDNKNIDLGAFVDPTIR